MSLPILIARKRFFDSDVEFVAQEKSRNIAEIKAEAMYIEESLNMVAVIEVNGAFNEDKYNVVFRIERNCNCRDLQRVFLYSEGKTFLNCPYCKLKFGKEEFVNGEPTEEEQNSEESGAGEGSVEEGAERESQGILL